MSTVLSRRLKKAREEYGISQKELGLLLGLSDKAISAYESARITPPVHTLQRISEELKKPLSYFVDENEESYKLQTRFASLEKQFTELQRQFMEIKELIGTYLSTPPDKKVNANKKSIPQRNISQAPPSLFS